MIERINVADFEGNLQNYSTLKRFQADQKDENVLELSLNQGRSMKFQYPYTDTVVLNETLFTANTFGGVETDREGSILSAQALSLKFTLMKPAAKLDKVTRKWSQEFNKLLHKEQGRSGHYNLLFWSWLEFETSVKSLFKAILVYTSIPLSVNLLLIIAICVKICGARCNIWVGTGPLVALLALVTVLSATSATIGIDGHLNVAMFQSLHFLLGMFKIEIVFKISCWKIIQDKMGLLGN